MVRPRILHVHSTFQLGGKEARAVRLMNAWGEGAAHVVLSAVPGAHGARAAIERHVDVSFPANHPPLTGRPSVARYRALASYMRGFDLVLTYNWGAMDMVMARRIFGGPPLIHHEDGFNEDETVRLKIERTVFRRLALPAASAVVVPSERLEGIARTVWRQPPTRVHRIANGIALMRYLGPPAANAIPGLIKRPGEIVVGTVAGLRAVKNLPRLVRAVAAAGARLRLVIVGEGPERDVIRAQAEVCGVADRVHLSGFLADPWRYVGLFDIFALSSDSEQFPISLVEAMAAGLPVAATAVGDIAAMVAEENRPYLAAPADEAQLGDALASLARDPVLRRNLGMANRALALRRYDEAAMIAAYRALYWRALERPKTCSTLCTQ